MNKVVIPALLTAVVMIAGIFAFMPVNEASTVHTTIFASTRAMITITDITLAENDRIVLIDNAGIGGTADVEITWSAPFFDGNCQIQTNVDTTAPFDTWDAVTNDGTAFTAGSIAHRDVQNVQAVALFANGGACDLDHAQGDWLTVSVVDTG